MRSLLFPWYYRSEIPCSTKPSNHTRKIVWKLFVELIKLLKDFVNKIGDRILVFSFVIWNCIYKCTFSMTHVTPLGLTFTSTYSQKTPFAVLTSKQIYIHTVLVKICDDIPQFRVAISVVKKRIILSTFYKFNFNWTIQFRMVILLYIIYTILVMLGCELYKHSFWVLTRPVTSPSHIF